MIPTGSTFPVSPPEQPGHETSVVNGREGMIAFCFPCDWIGPRRTTAQMAHADAILHRQQPVAP